MIATRMENAVQVRTFLRNPEPKEKHSMTQCLIALGGNIDVSEAVFREAMRRLERPGIAVRQLSRPVVTRPVGSAAGQEYVNAAALLECSLAPALLLKTLHEVEDSFGRERTIHWGPRTLDLDLCLFGAEIIDGPTLVVPHPAMWYRRFVLDPAVEVARSMTHPILRQTIEELRNAAMARPLRIEVASGTRSEDEIVSIVEHLKANVDDLREVQFVLADESSPVDSNVFARLLLECGEEQIKTFRQPPNESCRQIRLQSETVSELEQHVRQFFVAVLG